MNEPELCGWCDLWLDGELDRTSELAFLSHLEHCPNCAARVERWEALKLELEAACRLFGPTSDDLLVARESPDIEFKTKRNPSSARRLALSLCALLLIGLSAGLWLTSQWKTSRPASVMAEPIEREAIQNVISDQEKSIFPLVTVDIKAPAIASSTYSSPTFTVVQVYPVFRERD